MTSIEWTDKTWNPIVGCSIVSPGCTNCYAMKLAGTRLKHTPKYEGLTRASKAGPIWTGKLRLWEPALLEPLRTRKPAMWFVNSEGDLFHEDCLDEWIDRVFAVMAACPQHTFQVLTKRAERMREYFGKEQVGYRIMRQWLPMVGWGKSFRLPLPNVWLGVSTEDQKRAGERIPLLLQTPAAVRFISAEPLLGPIELSQAWICHGYLSTPDKPLDWVIVGGESGPGARPMHPDWARSLRDQCAAVHLPFFFKQSGAWMSVIDRDLNDPDWRRDYTLVNVEPSRYRICNLAGGIGFHGERVQLMERTGKKKAGRLLDGKEHNAFPEIRA